MLACTLWALVHSVLASKQAKDLARRLAHHRLVATIPGRYGFAYRSVAIVDSDRSAGCSSHAVP